MTPTSMACTWDKAISPESCYRLPVTALFGCILLALLPCPSPVSAVHLPDRLQAWVQYLYLQIPLLLINLPVACFFMHHALLQVKGVPLITFDVGGVGEMLQYSEHEDVIVMDSTAKSLASKLQGVFPSSVPRSSSTDAEYMHSRPCNSVCWLPS